MRIHILREATIIPDSPFRILSDMTEYPDIKGNNDYE